jgi:hypothetical protein
MKTKITVTSMEHEELVDLLSTALEGSNWFGASYDKKLYESIQETHGYCLEDKLADMLLSGHQITITDYEAEGESYSGKCTKITADGNAVYKVGLDDFLKVASTKTGFKLLSEVLDGTGDYYTADAFLQRVVFGEEIYG